MILLYLSYDDSLLLWQRPFIGHKVHYVIAIKALTTFESETDSSY